MRRGGSATGRGSVRCVAAVAGFVLAGGHSSRMGRDKALLDVGGEPLAARIARLMVQAAGSAVIIGDPQRYGILGFPVLPDRIAGLGPMGGLLTALETTTAPWNLLVACDMPGITAALLEEIAGRAQRAPDQCCIAAVSSRGPEPLCAAYHRACLPAVQRAVSAGRLRMSELLSRLNPVGVPVNDAHVLENVNTPAEWFAWQGPQG